MPRRASAGAAALRALAGAVLSAAALACASGGAPADPEVGAGRRRPPQRSQLVAGVRIAARAEWPASEGVRERVTPVRLEITNGSGSPLRLRYEDFALFSDAGERFNALPPYVVDMQASPRAMPLPALPAGSTISSTRFSVAPFLREAYPGLPAAAGPFPVDAEYSALYFPFWRELPLPAGEVLSRLLPEGVLDSGGDVSGFLYFQRIPRTAGRVALRADLVNARNGGRLGMVLLPLDLR